MLCLNISDITIITFKGIDYLCIIHDIGKSDALHLSENDVLDDRGYIEMHIKELMLNALNYLLRIYRFIY